LIVFGDLLDPHLLNDKQNDKVFLSNSKGGVKMDKDLRKVVKELEAQGYETRVTAKGHITVTRDGRVVAVFSGTPSDWRSMRNALARLRRAGFRWPPR